MTARWMIAFALVVSPAAAQAMDVATFVAKANALKAKGIFAVGSPDIALLKAEMTGVMRDYQADKARAQKAGRPFVCAPEGAKMSSEDLLKAFAAMPRAQQAMPVKAAFYRIVSTRWPCPKR